MVHDLCKEIRRASCPLLFHFTLSSTTDSDSESLDSKEEGCACMRDSYVVTMNCLFQT